VLLSPDYPNKRWCGLEWRWIRQLILGPAQDRIMLLRIGNPGDLSDLGIFAGDGYLDMTARAAAEISALILERMAQVGVAIPEAVDPGLEFNLAAMLRGAVKEEDSPHRFYISSPFSGLQNEREEAKNLITRQYHAYRDSYGGSTEPLVETCQRDVRASDHYILILGERYGTRQPDHEGKSVTELEFEAAVEAHLSIHAFFLGYVSDVDTGIELGAEARAALTGFRSRVKSKCVPVECRNQEDGRSGFQVFKEKLIALAANPPPIQSPQDTSTEWILDQLPEEMREKLI